MSNKSSNNYSIILRCTFLSQPRHRQLLSIYQVQMRENYLKSTNNNAPGLVDILNPSTKKKKKGWSMGL
ncbi:unnamed protein product [Coffea canephora]|uniref:Uncharacterized protein n=1 Tax=Coffea canephora TaxID=49390 RepID=A0A068U347_COFCA|nr:unnamed protein product [Coffea canephora]